MSRRIIHHLHTHSLPCPDSPRGQREGVLGNEGLVVPSSQGHHEGSTVVVSVSAPGTFALHLTTNGVKGLHILAAP